MSQCPVPAGTVPRGAEECWRQKGVIHVSCWSQTKQNSAPLEVLRISKARLVDSWHTCSTVPSRAVNKMVTCFCSLLHAEQEKPSIKMVQVTGSQTASPLLLFGHQLPLNYTAKIETVPPFTHETEGINAGCRTGGLHD